MGRRAHPVGAARGGPPRARGHPLLRRGRHRDARGRRRRHLRAARVQRPAGLRDRLGAVPGLPGGDRPHRALRAPLPGRGVRLGRHHAEPVGRRGGHRGDRRAGGGAPHPPHPALRGGRGDGRRRRGGAAGAGDPRLRPGVALGRPHRRPRPGHHPVVVLDRRRPLAGDAGLHRPRDGHQLRRRGARARAHAAAHAVPGDRRGGRDQRGGLDGRRLGVPGAAQPRRPGRRGRGPGHRLAAGAAAGRRHGDRRRAARRRGWFTAAIGVSEATHPDHRDGHRHGRRRAAGLLDGPLRHAAPRLRPPRAGGVAHRRRHAGRRRHRAGPDRPRRGPGQRGPLPRRALQLRRPHRHDRRPAGGGAPARARARPAAAVPRARQHPVAGRLDPRGAGDRRAADGRRCG